MAVGCWMRLVLKIKDFKRGRQVGIATAASDIAVGVGEVGFKHGLCGFPDDRCRQNDTR